jgi:hypothetical protein
VIETLVNARLLAGGVQDVLPAGWNAQIQVNQGTTIPDIVIRDAAGTEVAWFDITSAASESHIRDKVGSGWDTRPNIAEVLYTALDPTQLARTTVAERVGGRTRDRAAAVTERALLDNLHAVVTAIAEGWTPRSPTTRRPSVPTSRTR